MIVVVVMVVSAMVVVVRGEEVTGQEAGVKTKMGQKMKKSLWNMFYAVRLLVTHMTEQERSVLSRYI